MTDTDPRWPRGLSRDEAARYVGVGVKRFDTLVSLDQLPQPKVMGEGVYVWDRFWLKMPHGAGDVYFIRCNDRVKIGYAKNVEARLADLQVGSPYDLEILGTVSGGHEEEGRLHTLFYQDRIRGEWFRLSDAILAFIEENRGQ